MALRPAEKAASTQEKFTELNNLSNGAKILFASDDFFATAENLLKVKELQFNFQLCILICKHFLLELFLDKHKRQSSETGLNGKS